MFRGVLAEEMGLEQGVNIRLQFTEHFMTGFSNIQLRYPPVFVFRNAMGFKESFKSRRNYQNIKNGVRFCRNCPSLSINLTPSLTT